MFNPIRLKHAGLFCALLLIGCAKEDYTILPADLHLQAGDVAFRQGESINSQAVLKADRNSAYTHVGIVVDSAGIPMIIHAVPGEPDFKGDPDRIKMESPEKFFMRSKALIGEIMRPANADKAARAADTAMRLYRKGILFDHNYNDNDSTRMYCTELVLYAYRTIGINLAARPHASIKFPITFFGYFPSSIHASHHLHSVRKF